MNEDSSQNIEGADDLNDLTMQCIDCHEDFIWTIGEQQFFRDKGLQNPPKRCRPCKQAKNERIAATTLASQPGAREKIEITVVCARCEKNTTVPFYPTQGRPVLCRSCFIEKNPGILNPGNR